MDFTLRIHRDIFPKTDHGYTWVECIWFERDGKQISPTIPAAGCTERLGHMPGGPLTCNTLDEQRHYCGDAIPRIIKSEDTHTGWYKVGSVCITPA